MSAKLPETGQVSLNFPARFHLVLPALLFLFLVLLSPLPYRPGKDCSASGVPSVNKTDREYITVVAVGDIMMGTTYPAGLLPPDDGKNIFDGVKARMSEADVVIGNLEGPLVDNGNPRKCAPNGNGFCFEFATPTRYAAYLKDAGFNVLSMANNHVLDFGTPGAESTLDTLRLWGMEGTGGPSIARLQVQGLTVAVIGFSFGESPYAYSILDIERASKSVQELKKANTLVIVSFHGGAEGHGAQHLPFCEEMFLKEKRGDVVEFSRRVVDAGADMVLGHGPHVLRAMEIYRGKLIAFSLGNFLTYGMFNLKGPSGISVILKAKIDAKTGDFLEGNLVPVRLLKGGIPEIDSEGEAIRLLRQLMKKDLREPGLLVTDEGHLRRIERGR
jgi:hypothetical protein